MKDRDFYILVFSESFDVKIIDIKELLSNPTYSTPLPLFSHQCKFKSSQANSYAEGQARRRGG